MAKFWAWPFDVLVLERVKITEFVYDGGFHEAHLLSVEYWQLAGAAGRPLAGTARVVLVSVT